MPCRGPEVKWYNIAKCPTTLVSEGPASTDTMDKRLLAILCCPVSHKGLALARPDLLKRVNAAIAAGSVANREGTRMSVAMDEALVTDDGKLLYPVREGIPVLLEGESIVLEQLEAG